jgi:hypothetical protein
MLTPNQVQCEEHEFPFRKRRMIKQYLLDNSADVLFQSAFYAKWVPYNKFHVGNYAKVHDDNLSYGIVLS